MQSPQAHFQQIEAIFQKHAIALESEIRTLQQVDETAQWTKDWKQTYNWQFANCFAQQKVFQNWAADAAAWHLLPERVYPNRGNRKPASPTEMEAD